LLGVTLRAIHEKIRIPDACFMFYPATDFEFTVTPSKIFNMLDAIVPYYFLLLVRQAYVPKDYNIASDFYLSPIQAPKQYLAQFPKTYVISAGFDPLLDDNILFVHKMKKYAQNGVVFKIFDYRPHGFLNLYKGMPEVKDIIKESAKWFQEHLGDPNPVWKEFPVKSEPTTVTIPPIKTNQGVTV